MSAAHGSNSGATAQAAGADPPAPPPDARTSAIATLWPLTIRQKIHPLLVLYR